MNGGQRALDPDRLAQLLQGYVRVIMYQAFEALLVLDSNLRLSTREAIPGGDITCTAPLLQQFLDQAQRHVIPVCNLLPRPVTNGGCHYERLSPLLYTAVKEIAHHRGEKPSKHEFLRANMRKNL